MTSFSELMNNMNWWGLLDLVLTAVCALFCITFHEVSHGVVAWRLGDPTAKNAGRLTLNPIKHIDPFGLLLMIVAHVGWAKPVPVDMRYFKHPKRDMAITALAGPVSNFLLAVAALLLCSLIAHVAAVGRASLLALCFLSNLAVLSVGLGVFNLIPISPLDGSKVLFAFLPDKVYRTILHYERYVMIAVVALTFFGVFQRPLSFLITGVLRGLCAVTGYPIGLLFGMQDLSSVMQLIP